MSKKLLEPQEPSYEKLFNIVAEPELQMRKEENEQAIKEYAKMYEERGSDALPPITVVAVQTNDTVIMYVVDGHHRLKAANLAQIEEIPCLIYEGEFTDAIEMAAGANANHGVQRSVADKNQAVLRILGYGFYTTKPDVKIAKICNVSHTFVAIVRKRISGEGTARDTATIITPGGNKETINVPKDKTKNTSDGIEDTEPYAPPTDKVGNPISGDVGIAFAEAEKIDEIINIIAQARAQVKAIAKLPVGSHIHKQTVEAALKTAAVNLKDSRPHAVCPYCDNGCKTCNNQGWLGKTQYDLAPSEMKGGK